MTTKVIGIQSAYCSDTIEIPFNEKADVVVGDEVIFKDEEDREEYGVIKYVNCDAADKDKVIFTSQILRKATANDIQRVDGNVEKAREAIAQCKALIEKLGVDMNVFRASYSFDGLRIHFMFTSEDRVDFRDLVKDLAKILKKQINLRQIGPRDKAKMVGGYGKCGRPLCCSTWLGKLESIGMEMVRMQALESKGSAKLSGACGKLLCCLKYEVEAYRDLRKGLPNIGEEVRMKKGTKEMAKVIGLDILNQKMKVVSMSGEYMNLDRDDAERIKVNK
jgi:cell fate regulator YaaT (PSP1 superfamily)